MLQLPTKEKSLWRESYPPKPAYKPLQADLNVDVVVVGAGITGLTSAYLLKQAGLKVAVLEKDTVGGGTTGRTTGKVTAQHNLIYAQLQERLGKSTAEVYAQANQAAFEQVASNVVRENIDCGWEPDDNYVFTADPQQVDTFRREAAVAASLGLPATFETTSSLPFEIQAAVKFSGQAKMNAQQYVLGLAKAVHGNGSYVFEHSQATLIRDGQPAMVTAYKKRLTAKQVVVATNVPTLPLAARGSYCMVEYPTESYIVAAPYSGELRGMYISPDDNHFSILPIPAEGKSYLLIGGSAHISGMTVSRSKHYRQLADYAEQHFGIEELAYRWKDRDYLGYDSMPMIGKLYPWSRNLYVGTAFMKWGLTNGTMAGMLLRDLIVNGSSPWAETFTPHRLSPVRSIPRVIAEHLGG